MTICIDIISKGMITCICLWLQSHRDRDPQPQPQKYVVFNQLASSFWQLLCEINHKEGAAQNSS